MNVTFDEISKLLARYSGGRVPPLNELVARECIEVIHLGFVEAKDIPLAIVYPRGDWREKRSWELGCIINLHSDHRLYKPFCKFCREYRDSDGNSPLRDRCQHSDVSLAFQVAIGQKPLVCVCWNGLIDLAMPVILNDHTIAVVLTGQFLPEEGAIWNTADWYWDIEEHNYRGINVDLSEMCREKIAQQQNTIDTTQPDLWSLAQQHRMLSPDNVKEQMTMLHGAKVLLEEIAGSRMEAEQCRLQNYSRGELLRAPLEWLEFWEFLKNWVGQWHLPSNTYVYGVAGTLDDTEAWIPFSINTSGAKAGRYKITDIERWKFLLKMKPGESRTTLPIGQLLRQSGFDRLGGRVISLGRHGFLVYGQYEGGTLHTENDQSESIRQFGPDISRLLDNVQAVRARENFLTFFAHELRSPINSASFTTQRIRRKRFENSPQLFDKNCRRLQAQLDRLLKMIQNVWELQKILTGKTAYWERKEVSRTNLYGFLQQCVSQSKDMTEREDLRIVVDPEVRDLCNIDLDREGFELVVFNLLDNAFKYSSNGTEIRIHGRQERSEVVLTFTNIGIAIPRKEDGLDIFDRFARAKEAVCRAPQSAGIGLFLVKNIVEAHGGRAEASSVSYGPHDHLVKIELHLPTRQ